PLDVIGRHVEYGGCGAAQAVDPFQLVARQLADGDVELAAAQHPVRLRVAEVATGEDRESRSDEEVGGERGGGALPVGAGDAGDRFLDEAGGELHLSNHLDAAAPRLRKQRQGRSYAGAEHHEVAIAKGS